MANLIRTARFRATADRLPPLEEIEAFGADGEEVIYRLLSEKFDCVLRNVVVPHKKLYLEKDMMVIHRGVPFVLEIKHWKGEIGAAGGEFYQNKENGVHKTLKSPVGTTQQFISRMKDFYGITRPVYGVVVFSEPDCTLKLPPEMEGIALVAARDLVSYIKAAAKGAPKEEPVDPDRILRCTRFYSRNSEFSKGILADCYLDCLDRDGNTVRVDTGAIRFLSVEHVPLRMQDRLHLTYINGSTDVFYNRDSLLTVACLDGSYRKLALHRIRHIVF